MNQKPKVDCTQAVLSMCPWRSKTGISYSQNRQCDCIMRQHAPFRLPNPAKSPPKQDADITCIILSGSGGAYLNSWHLSKPSPVYGSCGDSVGLSDNRRSIE